MAANPLDQDRPGKGDPGISITPEQIQADVARKRAELGLGDGRTVFDLPGARGGQSLEDQYPVGGTVYDIMGMDPYAAASQQGSDLRQFQNVYNQTLNDAINATMARGQTTGDMIQGRYNAIVPGLRATNAEVSDAYRDSIGNLNKGYGALMGDFQGGMGQIAQAMAGKLRGYGTLGNAVIPAVMSAAAAPIGAGSRIAEVMAQFQNTYQNQLASGLGAAARYGDIATKGAQLRGAEDASMANLSAQAQADMLRSQLAQSGLGVAGQIASMNASALPAMLGVQLQAAGMADPLTRATAYQTMLQNQLGSLAGMAEQGKPGGPLQSQFERAREEYDKANPQSVFGR